MKITIRKATKADLPKIFFVEKRSYPPQLQATNKILEYRMDVFGIWVATVNKEIVGFFTCIPIRLPWPKPEINTILKNRHPRYKPWFEEYEKGGKFNTLWVTSTAVMNDYQKKGVGTALIKYSLELTEKLGLQYRASALRCQYSRFYNETKQPIQDYIKEVEKGNLNDKFLGPFLKLDFKLGTPLENYEPSNMTPTYNIFAFKKI